MVVLAVATWASACPLDGAAAGAAPAEAAGTLAARLTTPEPGQRVLERGADTGRVVDVLTFVNSYCDGAEAGRGVLEDFVRQGWAEGKDPEPLARAAISNAITFLDIQPADVRQAVLSSHARIFGGNGP